MEIVAFLVVALFFGGVGWWIATQKRRSEVEGAALGCILGPIGWIIEAVLPTGTEMTTRVDAWSQVAVVPRPRPKEIPQSLKASYWSSPDARRNIKGRDGHPPQWQRIDGADADDAIAKMVRLEASLFETKGQRVVEAAWQDDTDPTITAVFGDPSKEYDLLFPTKPRVKWVSTIGAASSDSPEPGPTSASDAQPAPLTPHPIRTSDESGAADQPATKVCPDCAETVLAAARICRFCRHEFKPEARPVAEPPPTPPVVAEATPPMAVSEPLTTPQGPPVPEPQPPAPEPWQPPAEQPSPPPPPSVQPPLPPPPWLPPPPRSPLPQQPWQQPVAPPPTPPPWQPPPPARPPGQGPPEGPPGPWGPPPTGRPPDRAM